MNGLDAVHKKLDRFGDQITNIDKKVDRLDQGINGGDGAVGLAERVEDHEKFIRKHKPMMVISRLITYGFLGSVALLLLTLYKYIEKLLGGGG